MKNIVFLFCISLAFFSCKKGNDTTTPSSTANFTINGLHDIDLSLSADSRATIPISIVPVGSVSDTVTLSIGDLPRGLYFGINPGLGKTPFNASLTFYSDFSGNGGSVPVTLTGTGHSGTRSYTFNVNIASYEGWKIDGGLYKQTGIVKNTDTTHENTNITVFGGGAGVLIISFAKGVGLPLKTTTYNITTGSNTGANNIQIGFADGPSIYSATGIGNPTGTFTIDTTGKFVFKCSDVEISDGVNKKTLDCSINE